MVQTCRRCGTDFNLEAQWYYDNLCPSCKAESDGVERTWPGCVECGDRFEPGSGLTAKLENRNMQTGTELVPVCSPKCKAESESWMWRGP